jgi:hypothetical protein
MSERPDLVRFRPWRIRVVAWIAAAVVVIASVVLAVVMPGGTVTAVAGFSTADRLALVALGLIGAAALLLLTRPRVEADRSGVRVRNMLGEVALPWQVVRAVRFEPGASWATLELHDDEVMGVLAVQAVDKERAVVAVRALRALHAASRREPA